jgi:hypothetical protein
MNYISYVIKYGIAAAWFNLKFDFCYWLLDAKRMTIVPKKGEHKDRTVGRQTKKEDSK